MTQGRVMRNRILAALPFLLATLFVLWPVGTFAFDPDVAADLVLGRPSIYCLDCHDGVLAAGIHHGHPVDTSYRFAYMRIPWRLKPPVFLDPAIYLNNGQVVCLSCHHPESPHESKLVLSNAGSKLCLACHNP
jgi:predicted CXXCH cytochrome family protein